MPKKFTVNEIAIMGLLSTMGIVCKPLLSPLANVLTDFIFIPGGSTVAGMSMMFLVIGAAVVDRPVVAAFMGFVQAFLALCIGVSGFQGALIFVVYTLPGFTIDFVIKSKALDRWHVSVPKRMPLAGALGNMTGAILTNLLFFRLDIIPMILFISFGAIFGYLGGWLGAMIMCRLPKRVPQYQIRR